MKDIKEYLPKFSTIITGLIVAQIKYLFELMGLFKAIPWLMGNIPLEITFDLIATCLVMYGIYGVLKVRFKHELTDIERARNDFESTKQAFIDQTQQNTQLLFLVREVLFRNADREKLKGFILQYPHFDAAILQKMGFDDEIVQLAKKAKLRLEIEMEEANLEDKRSWVEAKRRYIGNNTDNADNR